GCDGGEDTHRLHYENILIKCLLSKSLQDELNRQILEGLLHFIKRCCSGPRHTAGPWEARMRASEIPTAALVLGVNVPDHDMTFQSLCELLQQSVTPHVACLQAKECGALKSLMRKVLERLVGSAAEDEEEGDTHPHPKGAHCTLATLCEWRHTYLEAFNPRVLQDFILICSRYVEQLPLILVFGIATSPSTIQQVLPHSVSSLLCIELFQSLSCTQHLSTVMDKLILTHYFPFKPNAKVLQVLVSIFLYHDFSVRNFIKGLKLALLEHYLNQPLSVLCCEKKEEVELNTTQLSHRGLESVRQLASFRRYVEQQQPQEQVALLTSDQHMKETCKKLLKDLYKYHKNYYPVLRCLHALTCSLPRVPLGKQIRELHITCLEGNVWEREEYRSAMQLLRMLAKEELLRQLRGCQDILKLCRSTKMRASLERLQELLDQFERLDEAKPETAANEGMTSPAKSMEKKTDLFQLQKTLLEMKETRRTKKLSGFEILRNEALDFIDALVRSHLVPPETQPLHEVCYYSSSALLRRHLNATPRTSIQTALSSPYHYLQNDALLTEDGGVSNAAPDLCIVHKLHLECGRLINLYDWLEAYATVVSAAEGKDPESEEYGKVDELKHARFIQAVSELQFLGFIKSTKQKTDHVARLTWGGC
uniref:Origin recognition complex subunit 3 n=1 Tax=Gadus morhua TaxID=8049 RepID=A0A8C5ADF3_GADMO